MRAQSRYLVAVTLPLFANAVLVPDTTQAAFDSLLQENRLLLASFSSKNYAPAQSFHSMFEEAAQSTKTTFAVVDCDKEEELCVRYDINAYPAVRMFSSKDGENKTYMTRYRGRRTKKAIRSFVKKYEMPTATHIEPDSLQAFKTTDDIVFIAYLRPDQEALVNVFRSVASRHNHEFIFGYVTDMPTADSESLAMPSIACYKNDDGNNKAISGYFTETDIEKFLDEAKTTVIGDFSERDMDAYVAPGKLTAYIFAVTGEQATTLRRSLTPLAKKYDTYAIFCVADAVEFAPMAENFGLAKDTFPALVVHAPMNDNVFTYHQGKQIMAPVVEAMLLSILQAKAISGQVFGSEAPEVGNKEAQGGHDEL